MSIKKSGAYKMNEEREAAMEVYRNEAKWREERGAYFRECVGAGVREWELDKVCFLPFSSWFSARNFPG